MRISEGTKVGFLIFMFVPGIIMLMVWLSEVVLKPQPIMPWQLPAAFICLGLIVAFIPSHPNFDLIEYDHANPSGKPIMGNFHKFSCPRCYSTLVKGNSNFEIESRHSLVDNVHYRCPKCGYQVNIRYVDVGSAL